MAGFNGDLDARDNADLRRLLADEMPETFRWLLKHGIRFYGPMPEPPHTKPRMHNVLPNSRAFITHLGELRAALAWTSSAAFAPPHWWRSRAAWSASTARRPTARSASARAAAWCWRAGDFTSDPELKARFMGSQEAKIDGVNVTATGDGQKLALALGARIINGDLALGPELRFVPPPGRNMLLDAAALAAAGQPDGVVARAYAERAAAPVRDELRHHRAGAVARFVRGRRAA